MFGRHDQLAIDWTSCPFQRANCACGWKYALERWLRSLQPPPPIRREDDEAAQRGKALFERDALACTTCHAGERFTTDEKHDVGTGAALRVPALRGLGYRAPFMHSGCGATLAAALDPACFGTEHGDLSALNAADREDLVAYLQSL